MGFFHGVRYSEVPTQLVPPANVNASLTMAFGTAPIHRLGTEAQEKAMPGSIHLVYTNAEAAQKFGIDIARDDTQKWGLSQVAFNRFSLFNVAPVIFVNLFNPAIHRTSVTGEAVVFNGNSGFLRNSDVMGNLTL